MFDGMTGTEGHRISELHAGFIAAGYEVCRSRHGDGMLVGVVRFAPKSHTGTGPCAYARTELEAYETLWLNILGYQPSDPAESARHPNWRFHPHLPT